MPFCEMECVSIQHIVFFLLFGPFFCGNRDAYLARGQVIDLAHRNTGISKHRLYRLNKVMMHEMTRGYDTRVDPVSWQDPVPILLFTLIVNCELELNP